MVQKLHALYPNAFMVWTHTNSNAGKYAVSAMTDKGIMQQGYMKVAIIPKVNNVNGTVGANGHNSIVTHIETAEIIADTLTTNWGFQRIVDNIVFEDYENILKKF
jgi:tRNA(Ile2) C34 agmatinyltransferase TiaS